MVQTRSATNSAQKRKWEDGVATQPASTRDTQRTTTTANGNDHTTKIDQKRGRGKIAKESDTFSDDSDGHIIPVLGRSITPRCMCLSAFFH